MKSIHRAPFASVFGLLAAFGCGDATPAPTPVSAAPDGGHGCINCPQTTAPSKTEDDATKTTLGPKG